MKRRLGRVLSGAVALSCLLAACASPRNSLGSGSSACFKAIPAAQAAEHHKGRLVGVRQVDAARLAPRHPEFAPFGHQTLCLVAYAADFQPGDVPAATQQAGKYAVIAVELASLKVAGAWVSQSLPIRFGHPV